MHKIAIVRWSVVMDAFADELPGGGGVHAFRKASRKKKKKTRGRDGKWGMGMRRGRRGAGGAPFRSLKEVGPQGSVFSKTSSIQIWSKAFINHEEWHCCSDGADVYNMYWYMMWSDGGMVARGVSEQCV